MAILVIQHSKISDAGHLGAALRTHGQKVRTVRVDLGQPLPADLAKLLAAKEKTLAWKPDHEWHELVLVTEGDELRVTLDGIFLGSHRSPGFGHPVKRWLSLAAGSTVWIDDVRVYRVR